jgi:hypothetical protein
MIAADKIVTVFAVSGLILWHAAAGRALAEKIFAWRSKRGGGL